MEKKTTINVRIDADVKRAAEKILHKMGISQTKAINMFYRRIILCDGLPFETKIPNEKTQEAMLDFILKRNLSKLQTFDEWLKRMEMEECL